MYEANRHEYSNTEHDGCDKDWGSTSRAFRDVVTILDHYLNQPRRYRQQLSADYIVTRLFRVLITLRPEVARAYGEGYPRFLKALEEARKGYTPFSEEDVPNEPPL